MSGPTSSNTSGQPDSFRPYAQVVAQDPSHAGGAFVAVQGGDSETSPEAWTVPPASSFVSKEDAPLSPGHMNPQATAFAPAYPSGAFCFIR